MSQWNFTVLPAYGRDYGNKTEVMNAWKEGKDFQDARTGQYLSQRDQVPGEVWVRYAQRSKVIRVK